MTGRAAYELALGMVPALQHKGSPPNRKACDPFNDPVVRKSSDDSMSAEQKNKMEADRLRMMTEEEQKALARDAAELVRMVTELQTQVSPLRSRATGCGSRLIGKMTRSMKKRAKGEQR